MKCELSDRYRVVISKFRNWSDPVVQLAGLPAPNPSLEFQTIESLYDGFA